MTSPRTDSDSAAGDAEVDVVVVGSGGAGLVTACAAAERGVRVLVLEATDELGGTTALSGGQLWLPGNPQMLRSGFVDSRSAAAAYLRRVVGGATPEAHLDAFLEQAPAFAEYLESGLGIALQALDRHDYHPTWAGAARGRSVEPLPVAPGRLTKLGLKIRTSLTRGPLTSAESRSGLPAELVRERIEGGVRTQGGGLVTGLVDAAIERGVLFATGRRVVNLRRAGPGDMFTVIASNPSGIRFEHRTPVVVLATGGFAGNADLRHDFLPMVELIPTTAAGAVGDAIRLGLAHGAHLRGMSEAWWTPATRVPGDGSGSQALNLVRELAYPGSILVNARAARFVDEASSYNDLTKVMLRFDPDAHDYPNAPAWLIFDERFRRTYRVAGASPDLPAPSWFTTAPTLEALAEQLGIDSAGLRATAARMNKYAATGVDPEFGRGGNPHDTFNGDAFHTPNACLGPIDAPPLHAVAVHPGLNGTKGGLVTDEAGAVLDHDQRPIKGLFACGEAAAALMGPGYAGSGASLGPALTLAMTIGHRAAGPVPLQPKRT